SVPKGEHGSEKGTAETWRVDGGTHGLGDMITDRRHPIPGSRLGKGTSRTSSLWSAAGVNLRDLGRTGDYLSDNP
ncbi:MAG TPA: hypothetical protein VGA50_19985, partial [Kiloniellales bacterium]